MKRRFISYLIMAILAFVACDVHAGRCTGSGNCHVCSDCSRCKHCNQEGGTCGVCAGSSIKPQNTVTHTATSFPWTYVLIAGAFVAGLLIRRANK